MKTGQRFFKKMMVALLSAAVIATMIPTVVFAAGKTYTSATAVKFGQKYNGTLSDNNSVDWYKIVLPTSGLLTVKTQAGIERVTYYFFSGEDCDKQMEYRNVSWNSVSGYSNETSRVRLASGTYYLRVSKYNNYDGEYNGDYNIIATFESAGESFKEPIGGINNTFKTATAIALNTEYHGQLCQNDDKDYYKFELPVDAEVSITGTAYMTWIYYYLFNAAGEQIDKKNPSWDSALGCSQRTYTYQLEKGTYYFVATRDGGNDGIYDFKISSNIFGWQHDNNGWWYRNVDGSYPKSKWMQISNVWYYFSGSGYCVTGWNKIGGTWYYFNGSGAMQVGWQLIGGRWYHFDGNGKMQVGWIMLQGKWYHFDNNGAMQTGWQQHQNKWYYFNDEGVLQIGWICVGGKWYHTDSNGVMQTGWQQLQGKWYYFKSSGVMAANEWVGNYYLQADGSMRS